MILSEVIPFLVLAIGVDNVFLITYAFDQPLALPRSSPQNESSAESESIGNTRSTPLLSNMHMEAGLVLEGVERARSAVIRVGPSIVCAAAGECAAFLIGATTGPPAYPSFLSNFLCLVLVCLVYDIYQCIHRLAWHTHRGMPAVMSLREREREKERKGKRESDHLLVLSWQQRYA